jgi:hypothetical protein
VPLNVEVMWFLRGLKPDFRTSATAKLALVALNTTEVLPHPAIPANAALRSLARTGGPTPRELSCVVWLWDARERDAGLAAATPVSRPRRFTPDADVAESIPGDAAKKRGDRWE